MSSSSSQPPAGGATRAAVASPGKGPKLAGTNRSDAFIINRIKNGKEGAMPAFGGTFDDKEIKAIVAYIHSLKDDGR